MGASFAPGFSFPTPSPLFAGMPAGMRAAAYPLEMLTDLAGVNGKPAPAASSATPTTAVPAQPQPAAAAASPRPQTRGAAAAPNPTMPALVPTNGGKALLGQ